MKRIKILSHRGNFLPEGPIPEVQDRYTIPENTLEAFSQAFKKGWGIETDIRQAGDNDFVVIHDGDIKRFSDQEGTIDKMSVSKIKEFGYKTNPEFKIPTLDELCQIANGSFIAFQVKRGSDPESGVKVGRAVAGKMEQYNLKNSILFDSTIEEAEVLRKEFPWMNLSVSVGEENYSPTIYTPDQIFTDRFKKTFNCIWADEWTKQGSIYNKQMFERFKQTYPLRIDVISPELHFKENHPLSKNLGGLKELWKDITEWGTADGICSDYPSTLSSLT